MKKISPIEKEIRFLYNKHNKNTKYPLEIEKIEFPLYIIKILEKTRKPTELERKKLTAYRKRILYDLRLKSWHLENIENEKKEIKRKEIQQKIAKNKDIKYEKDPTKIKHFGIWFDNNDIKLCKDNYAKIDKKVHNKLSSFLLNYYEKHPAKRKRIYEDEKCSIYTNVWCARHQQDCLKNFDLNMSFYSNLEKDKFEKALSSLLGKRKNFKQIYDINECEKVEGIYILVLDDYKQLYIGQSKNIKNRIIQHWRKNKEFDRLIFGKVETSILPIDAFRCLDTTRIFVLEAETIWDMDHIEKTLIDSINKKYLLNRTAGGIHGNDVFAILEIEANRNERKLQ